MVQMNEFNLQTTHSAILSASTAVFKHPINWQPDFWVIVARLTAGHIMVYPSAEKGGLSFRLDRGTITVPMHNDTFTVETVGASGWYSLYAVRNLDGLVIEA